jgi:D-alanine-D-alanine ligase
MKKAALACGVKVPAWRFVYNERDLKVFLEEFHATTDEPFAKFPLLVKHFSSYASVGLTKESKVWNVFDLEKQCQRMLDTYGGCLVEEFIEGREFTVLVAQVPGIHKNDVDVVAYHPVECKFGEGEDFKHYNLKWIDYDNIGWRQVEDLGLAERMKTLARNVFRAIQGRGYGRLDIRSDESGENLYFLEINPNCGIFYPEGFYGSADFILDKKDSLRAHADFALDQVEVAMRLWKEKNHKVCEARYDARKQSWGMFALYDLRVGDLILEYEETPFHLVSKEHVLKTWCKQDASETGDIVVRNWVNFASYCWPVADDLFAMWSPDSDEWKPINHSCDPNAWNQGLNVVARRDILAGEEICMDYAAFTGYFPEMKSFDCSCKSSECRRVITGLDILKPEVALKYRGHMTSYMEQKAREALEKQPVV